MIVSTASLLTLLLPIVFLLKVKDSSVTYIVRSYDTEGNLVDEYFDVRDVTLLKDSTEAVLNQYGACRFLKAGKIRVSKRTRYVCNK